MVMVCENSSDNILVKIQTKCQFYLLCDPGVAEPGIAQFYLEMVSTISLDGPLGPGLARLLAEYRSRYFLCFSAAWNLKSVEGLMIMAARAIRRGFRNSVQYPNNARSWIERLGARFRDLP